LEQLQLPRLLNLTNRTFTVFNQPGLYSSNGDGMDGFHVSLAWSLAEPNAEVKRQVEEVLTSEGLRDGKIFVSNDNRKLAMEVSGIRVKIGNAVHVVELGAGKPEAVERKRKASVGS
jgi:hypothetical protein